MSITPTHLAGPLAGHRPATRRVRHQAREAAALMAFSAATSIGLASALMLLASLGR